MRSFVAASWWMFYTFLRFVSLVFEWIVCTSFMFCECFYRCLFQRKYYFNVLVYPGRKVYNHVFFAIPNLISRYWYTQCNIYFLLYPTDLLFALCSYRMLSVMNIPGKAASLGGQRPSAGLHRESWRGRASDSRRIQSGGYCDSLLNFKFLSTLDFPPTMCGDLLLLLGSGWGNSSLKNCRRSCGV